MTQSPAMRKFEMSLVLAGPGFLGFGKYGSHAGVRHVGFQRNPRSRYRPGRRVGQFQEDGRGSDLRRFGRDCVLNRDGRRGSDRPGAPISQPSGHAGEQEKT